MLKSRAEIDELNFDTQQGRWESQPEPVEPDPPYVEPDLDLVVNGVSLREFLGEEL